MRFVRSLRCATAALLTVVSVACSGLSDITGPTTEGAEVSSVTMSTASLTVSEGGSAPLSISVRDAEGRAVTDQAVSWTSSDTLVARVSATGVVTGVRAGSAQIAASVQGRSAVLRVTVVLRAVATITLSHSAPRLHVGGSVQLSALLRDDGGTTLGDRTISWTSSDPTVVAVDATGFVVAITAGVATIQAQSEGRTAAVGVVVSPVPVATVQISPSIATLVAGQNTQMVAVPRDSAGAPLIERVVAWSTSAPAIVTVSASGVVLAVTPGRATISAMIEGVQGSAEVVVLPRPIGAVIVSPAQRSLAQGDTAQITVQITDDDGNLLTGRPISFASANTGVASVSASGLVRAVGVGSTTIEVESEGRQGRMSVIVTPTQVETVRIAPATLTLSAGGSGALTAIALDAAGNTLAQRSVTWTSGAPSVVTVSPAGVVRAVGAGSAIVFGIIDGRVATASVTVRAPVVATVIVSPSPATLFVSSTIDLSVLLLSASGDTLPARAIEWRSNNEALVAVSSQGRARGLALGSTRLDATVDGVTGSSDVTVLRNPVASVSLTLTASSLIVGASTQAIVTLRDLGGNILSGREVTWTSTNPAVATVSTSGVVRSVTIGTATIVATSEGISGSALLTVSPVPVAAVTVALAHSARFVGQTTQATATTRDGNGNVLTGRGVSWRSSDTTVATVSTNGLVLARAVGSATITATSEGISGAAVLAVALVPVDSVSVTLARDTVIVGNTTTATALLRDSAGNVLTGRVVTWTSSNNTIATVSAQGVVTSRAVGSANIIATSGGKSGTRAIVVRPVPVVTVSVALARDTVLVGQSTTATAVPRDSAGSALAGRTITWSSSNMSVATVDASGTVRAIAVGIVSISATVEGVTGSRSLVVRPVPVTSVVVSLAKDTLLTGSSTTATAAARDSAGNLLTGRTVSWTSTNTGVATVDANGVVRAVAEGTAGIRATIEGVAGTTQLVVMRVPIVTIEVTLQQGSLAIGGSTQATAIPRDSAGTALTGRVIAWSSSSVSVATVDAAGRVTAVAAGSANIIATSEGISGLRSVTVQPVRVASVVVSLVKDSLLSGTSTTATAQARDSAGNVLTGRAVSWSSTNTSVATVDTAGLVRAVAEGTVAIRATIEGVNGSAQLVVIRVPLVTIEVTLQRDTLSTGGTTQATAIPRDSAGNTLTGRVIVWSSSNNSIATVDATGRVTAVAAGTANIIATSEGISGQRSVTVQAVPVARVTVALAKDTLLAGASTTATATARDSAGNLLTGRTVSWTSTNTGVATVDANGVVRAVAEGTAGIRATIEGVAGTTQLVVMRVPIVTIEVTLQQGSLAIGGSTQATAIPRDSAGNALTGRVIAWSSSNNSIATVDSTGRVTAVATGSANIVAASEGVSGQRSVTVQPVPVARVTVSLAKDTLLIGATTTATVLARDSAGNVLTGRAVSWTSSNTNVATVDSAGVVRALTAGTAGIRAVIEGVADTAQLVVIRVPITSIDVSLQQDTLSTGGTTQATAIPRDSAGNALTGRVIVWSSSNNTIATVDATGRVTAVAAGTANIIATSDGISGQRSVTVRVQPVSSVVVSVAKDTVLAGSSTTATAVARDSAGNVLTGRAVSWTSSNTSVATVDSAGVVRALTPGTAGIRAVIEGVADSAQLVVIRVPIVTIDVTLQQGSLAIGGSTQATAIPRDSAGSALTGRVIAWSSSNNSIATVDSTGRVTAVAAGSANIIATSEGISGQRTLTVQPVPVASVTVTLADTSLIEGAGTTATAVVRDGNGNVLTGRPLVWTSSDTAVATVDSLGNVLSIAPGTALIRATTDGVTGSASLVVHAVPVAMVVARLNADTLTVGDSTLLRARVRDSADNELTGRVVTFSSADTLIATINSAGVVRAIAAGTVVLTATAEGVSGTATLVVILPPQSAVVPSGRRIARAFALKER